MEAEAFGYVNGKLYFGHNHLQVATQAFEGGDIEASHLPTPSPDYINQGPVAFGWIFGNEVEFYSNEYQDFNEEAFEQHSALFDKVFQEIKKKYPKVTEMTMMPGEPQ